MHAATIDRTPFNPPGEKDEVMSPPREAREAPSVDASKLSFPLQLVIVIASAIAAVWASQYGLRSDVRDILTRMEAQAKIFEIQTKAQDDRMAETKGDIEDMKRRLELLQLQYQSLRETIMTKPTR